MTTSTPLCLYCSKVPLAPGSLQGRAWNSQTEWDLGHGQRIVNSNCPLCKVVVDAFQRISQTNWRQHDTKLSEMGRVSIHLFSATGPGNRSAFTVDPAGLKGWLCLAAPSPNNTTQTSQPTYLVPRVDPEFDISRLKRWVSVCASGHQECSFGTSSFERVFPGLQVLRLIDVVKGCLVELRSVPQYVALSYVWGEVASVRLTTTNRPDLLQPRGIARAEHMIPRTIQDAIELVRRLNAQYLWVDALCLIQNDSDDLARGVNVMDQIYEGSWLTIIAAGIREGSRPEATMVTRITHETSLGVYTPLDVLLKRSMYSTRAWTFQEQMLARRSVYFVDNRIFFRCRRDVYAEHLVDHYPRADDSNLVNEFLLSMLPLAASMEDPFTDFENMLLYYTRRALTNQSDVLRALAGIQRRLEEKTKCRFFQGMPTVAFDAFIVFEGFAGVGRRRNGFPSYSWTGWRGEITVGRSEHRALYKENRRGVFYSRLNQWLSDDTWIIWYKRSPSGVVNLVWDPSANESFPFGNLKNEGYRKRRPFRPPEGILKNFSATRTYPTEDLPFKIPTFAYPILQFWTLSLLFRIKVTDVFVGKATILARDGLSVGDLQLDGLEETAFFQSTQPLELILMSTALSDEKGANLSLNPTIERSMYFVMLLEWKNHVAERRGMGMLQKEALNRGFSPGPQWKEILLS